MRVILRLAALLALASNVGLLVCSVRSCPFLSVLVRSVLLMLISAEL